MYEICSFSSSASAISVAVIIQRVILLLFLLFFVACPRIFSIERELKDRGERVDVCAEQLCTVAH